MIKWSLLTETTSCRSSSSLPSPASSSIAPSGSGNLKHQCLASRKKKSHYLLDFNVNPSQSREGWFAGLFFFKWENGFKNHKENRRSLDKFQTCTFVGHRFSRATAHHQIHRVIRRNFILNQTIGLS